MKLPQRKMMIEENIMNQMRIILIMDGDPANVMSLNKIIEKNPVNGLIFFKRLTGLLANRLLQTYKMISVSSQRGHTFCFGTGQLLESDVTIT